jgi:hypothetical protein
LNPGMARKVMERVVAQRPEAVEVASGRNRCASGWVESGVRRWESVFPWCAAGCFEIVGVHLLVVALIPGAGWALTGFEFYGVV